MTRKDIDFESGTAGFSITPANAPGVTSVSAAGGSAQYTSAFAYSGQLGARFAQPTRAACSLRINLPASSMRASLGFAFTLQATPPAGTGFVTLGSLRSANGTLFPVFWTEQNELRIYDQPQTTTYTLYTGAVPGTPYFISQGITVDASGIGSAVVRLYDLAGALLASLDLDSVNLGTIPVVTSDVGVANLTHASSTVVFADSISVDDSTGAGILPPARSGIRAGAAAGVLTLAGSPASSGVRAGTVSPARTLAGRPATVAAQDGTASAALTLDAAPAIADRLNLAALAVLALDGAPLLAESLGLTSTGTLTLAGRARVHLRPREVARALPGALVEGRIPQRPRIERCIP